MMHQVSTGEGSPKATAAAMATKVAAAVGNTTDPEAAAAPQAGTETTAPSETTARVLWVGNVPRGLPQDELRALFKAALPAGGPRVTHVRVKRHGHLAWDSATVFISRRVAVLALEQELRKVAAGKYTLIVRKCRGQRRRDKRRAARKARGQVSELAYNTWLDYRRAQFAVAEEAAVKFFATASMPPVGVSVCARQEFAQQLDCGGLSADMLRGLREVW